MKMNKNEKLKCSKIQIDQKIKIKIVKNLKCKEIKNLILIFCLGFLNFDNFFKILKFQKGKK